MMMAYIYIYICFVYLFSQSLCQCDWHTTCIGMYLQPFNQSSCSSLSVFITTHSILELFRFPCDPTRGYFGGGRIPIARGQIWPCFGHFSRGDPSLSIFSKTKL